MPRMSAEAYKQFILQLGSNVARGQAFQRREKARDRMKRVNGRLIAPARRAARVGGNPRNNMRSAGWLGLELKFLDQAIVGVALTAPTDAAGAELDPTGSSVLCIGHPPQGDGPSDRDGRTYVVKSVNIDGVVTCASQIDQTAVDTAATIRLYLVLDTQTNGAQLNSEDVFTNPSAAAVGNGSGFRNLLHMKRFKVLDSVQFSLPQAVITWDGTNVETGGFSVPFQLSWRGSQKVIATSTTGVVATVDDYSFHVIGYATNITAAPLVTYNARTRFMG